MSPLTTTTTPAQRARASREAEDKQHAMWHALFGDECRRGPACYRKEAK